MILFYDTETTGLPLYKQPSEHPGQPHIVQLAMLLTDDNGAEKGEFNVIVKPEGWIIPDDVAAIHGITQERALVEGIPEKEAVSMYVLSQAMSSLRVAHNQSFDQNIMRIAMLRTGITREFIEFMEGRPARCTCDEAAPIVNLPPTDRMLAAGFNKPKPPKLTEAIKFFFNEELDGAHDAMVDVRACKKVFFHLKRSQS